MNRIYLDYNATAPMRPQAASVWSELAATPAAQNPSSVHWAGQAARRLLRIAREDLARVLQCSPGELVFTSGGSEANALALHGVSAQQGDRAEVWASSVEHPSVLGALPLLERLFGMRGGLLPVDGSGQLDVAAVAASIGPKTRLVSLMLANNETGVLQPVREVAKLARETGALSHCDATQAAGKLPFSPRELGVDLLSLGGHKFGAGPGLGLLYVREGVSLRPLFPGHQENGLRAGTENVAAACAAAAALRAASEALPTELPRLARLRDRLEHGIAQRVSESWVNGAGAPRLCNTLNVGFAGVEGEALVIALDLAGVAVSSGSACASGMLEPSGVLLAMGQDATRASSAVRFSLGPASTDAEIDRVLEILPGLVVANRQSRTRPSTS